jgi:T-complex protein 1 subunit beta
MAIELADFEGVERLALVTGGEIASTFDHPELVTLGECDLIEEIMIGEDKVCNTHAVTGLGLPAAMRSLSQLRIQSTGTRAWHTVTNAYSQLIKFSGVRKAEACTIVLRGATKQILDEAERSLHDALCVLSQTTAEPRIVFGGGCAEMEMSNAVDKLAAATPGKESVAMEAFARALRQLPTIIADNAGYDSTDLVSQLRAAHTGGNRLAGLSMHRCMQRVR